MRWTRFYHTLVAILAAELIILAAVVVGGLFYTIYTN